MLAEPLTKKVTQAKQEGRTLPVEYVRDLALIQRIADQDEAALRELYASYGQRMYSYALRLTDQPQVAEDVVQDTLVVVWQSAGRFRGEGRVLAWLLGIVHHTALKALRHRSRPITQEMETSLASCSYLPTSWKISARPVVIWRFFLVER